MACDDSYPTHKLIPRTQKARRTPPKRSTESPGSNVGDPFGLGNANLTVVRLVHEQLALSTPLKKKIRLHGHDMLTMFPWFVAVSNDAVAKLPSFSNRNDVNDGARTASTSESKITEEDALVNSAALSPSGSNHMRYEPITPERIKLPLIVAGDDEFTNESDDGTGVTAAVTCP